MIDVHVLTIPSTDKSWRAFRQASLQVAVALADVPVVLHEMAGYVGHIGKGRLEGYRLGTNPYVTYVDDDDWVAPKAFVFNGALDGGDKYESWEQQWHNGKYTGRVLGHHLNIYKREAAEQFDHLAYTVDADAALASSVKGCELPDIRYFHRLHESAGRKLRRAHGRRIV